MKKENEIDFRQEKDNSYTVIVNGKEEARFDGENGLKMAYQYAKSRQYE